jgi:hypothetical protein
MQLDLNILKVLSPAAWTDRELLGCPAPLNVGILRRRLLTG